MITARIRSSAITPIAEPVSLVRARERDERLPPPDVDELVDDGGRDVDDEERCRQQPDVAVHRLRRCSRPLAGTRDRPGEHAGDRGDRQQRRAARIRSPGWRTRAPGLLRRLRPGRRRSAWRTDPFHGGDRDRLRSGGHVPQWCRSTVAVDEQRGEAPLLEPGRGASAPRITAAVLAALASTHDAALHGRAAPVACQPADRYAGRGCDAPPCRRGSTGDAADARGRETTGPEQHRLAGHVHGRGQRCHSPEPATPYVRPGTPRRRRRRG